MDITSLSIVMSQSRAQQSAGIEVMKMAMDTGKENCVKMTEMMNNIEAESNLGNDIDVSA